MTERPENELPNVIEMIGSCTKQLPDSIEAFVLIAVDPMDGDGYRNVHLYSFGDPGAIRAAVDIVVDKLKPLVDDYHGEASTN